MTRLQFDGNLLHIYKPKSSKNRQTTLKNYAQADNIKIVMLRTHTTKKKRNIVRPRNSLLVVTHVTCFIYYYFRMWVGERPEKLNKAVIIA